jgi:hypothetical protein
MTTRKRPWSGTPNIGNPFFPIDGLPVHIERIVIDDLFGLARRNLMSGDMIAIGIIPVKSQIGVQVRL